MAFDKKLYDLNRKAGMRGQFDFKLDTKSAPRFVSHTGIGDKAVSTKALRKNTRRARQQAQGQIVQGTGHDHGSMTYKRIQAEMKLDVLVAAKERRSGEANHERHLERRRQRELSRAEDTHNG